jgi:hypothetical protein
MAALTEEQRTAMREASRSAAHALSDDLKHIREVIGKEKFTAGDLRRMSNQLRRILIEHDLRTVAAPRVGRIRIEAPQLKAFHHLNEKRPIDLFSGGKLVFRHMEMAHWLMTRGPMTGVRSSPDDTVALNVEQFIAQRVLCFRGRWATRTSIIKYVGIAGHGIHSEDARKDPEFEFLDEVKRYARIEFTNGLPHLAMNMGAMSTPPEPWKPAKDQIDLALLQLMSTAQYLVNSPEVVELERLIDEDE